LVAAQRKSGGRKPPVEFELTQNGGLTPPALALVFAVKKEL